MSLPWLGRIKTTEEYDKLVELAKADGHTVFNPTHLVTKNGHLSGYASIAVPGVPLVLCWLDTKQIHARDSKVLLNVVENHVALNGASGLFTPVLKSSPFHPHMEKFGYVNCGNYDLFLKTL